MLLSVIKTVHSFINFIIFRQNGFCATIKIQLLVCLILPHRVGQDETAPGVTLFFSLQTKYLRSMLDNLSLYFSMILQDAGKFLCAYMLLN